MRTLRNNTRWIMIGVVVIFALSIFAGYGMYTGGGGERQDRGGEDYAVAEINGRKVMRSQLLRSVRNLAEQQQVRNVDPQTLVQLRKEALSNMAISTELQKEVDRRDIQVSDGEIKEAMDRIIEQFVTKESFMDYLKRNDITEREVREQLKNNIARQKLLESAGGSITVSADAVRQTYADTKDFMFTEPFRIGTLVAHFKSAETARNALQELRIGGGWDQVMASLSGDVDQFTSMDQPAALTERQVPAVIWDTVASMDRGATSGPVEVTSADFYVLRRISSDEGGTLPFDDVSADIRQMLVAQKRQEAQQQYMEKLRERAGVEILDKELFKAPSPDQTPASEGRPQEVLSGAIQPGTETGASPDLLVSPDREG